MEYTFHDQVSSITQYNTITWRRLLSSKKSLRCRGSCKPRKNFSHKIKSWLAVTFWRSLSEKLCSSLTQNAALCMFGHSSEAPYRREGRRRPGFQYSLRDEAGTVGNHSRHLGPPWSEGCWQLAAKSAKSHKRQRYFNYAI